MKSESKFLWRAGVRFLRVTTEDVAAALWPGACRACGAPLPERPGSGPGWSRALHDGTLRRTLWGPLSLPLWFRCPSCAATLERSRGAHRLRDPDIV